VHAAKTYTVILGLVSSCFTVLAQSMFAQSKPAQPALPTAVPQLDHFDVTQVESSPDPCVDFYQYTCKKNGTGEYSFPKTVAYGFKRAYPATGILHILCRNMVLERNSPVSRHDGAIQSPCDRTGPRERCGIQHAGIPESLRLQEGSAQGAGKRLSRLVEADCGHSSPGG
jgi:hypothetical protein